MRLSACSVMLALICGASLSEAQVATPTGHWGGNMLPELEARDEVGLHFVGFTQYGKEAHGDPLEYTFIPYNDINETLGFNFLTFTRSTQHSRFSSTRNALSTRTTVMAGVVNDAITEWLQNDVIHWANFRRDSLDRVPRRRSDTFSETSRGPTKDIPIFGVSHEYILRLQNTRRVEGREEIVPTPFFVGAGAALSTINHEAFLQAGVNVVEIDLRPRGPTNRTSYAFPFGRVLSISSVGLGGMARTGVLVPAVHFDDLTSHFASVQAIGRVGLLIGETPVEVDLALTGAEGFFVRSRSQEELDLIRDVDRPVEDVYQAKTPMRERFISLRIRSGGFTLETYNDTLGGKDKGPSFGAHVAFTLSALGWRR
jgi:hypothetical protein